MKHIFFPILLISLLFASCKKEEVAQYNPNIKAELTVEFDNIAGLADVQLNTGSYINAANESFKISKLKYYVSNFIFTNTDGAGYVVPQDSCYFLIDESDVATLRPKFKIPEGEYKTLTFTIGVDSLRNTMDISKRTGVLDPTIIASDMYWSWNSGYIFFKMEGTSTASPAPGNVFQYHIGGFGGYNIPTTNNLKTVTLDLSQRGTAQVKSGKGPANIHLFVDILKALNGNSNLSFAATPMIHSALAGKIVADNYESMVQHDHTEN